MKMSNTRVLVIIGLVWLASFFITFPPMFAERFGYIQDVCKGKANCSSCESLFDLVPVYVIFATISSFFVPVLLVIITNYRTYLIVKKHMFARANNGRISLSTANKPKSKKLKFFIDLLTNTRDKNSQIELNSLEQRQPKSPTVPNKPVLTSPNNKQQFTNGCCCCDQDLLDNAYLQTSDLSNRNLFGLRLTKFFSWLMRRDCSSIDSKYVESRLISTAPHNAHFVCNHFHHCHHHLNRDMSSFEKSKGEPKTCLAKLGKCLGKCCATDTGVDSKSSSRFQNMRAFFLNHTNSSNIQILDIDMNNSGHHNLSNLKSCTHCALNSLVAYRAAQLGQPAKSEPLFLNEDLLMVDEESTSTGSKNRLDCSAKEASISILVNVSSRAESNGELVNENCSNNLKSVNPNEASSDLNDLNAQCSVLSSIGNLSPNGCLMSGRCMKEAANCGMLGCGRTSAKNCNKSSRASYCCGYCCSHCTIAQQSVSSVCGCCSDERCPNCRPSDLNRSLDIYSSKTGQIRSNKSSIRSNSKADNSSSKSTATTKTTFSKSSNDKDKMSERLAKPQHHLNCAHFKGNQLAYSKQPAKAMTLIRCDHCGHTLLHDQCKTAGSSQPYAQCKTVCLNRFANQTVAFKSGRKDHQCLSTLQKHHIHQPKCCAYSRPQLLNGSTIHFDHHHCIHLHFQLQQHLYQQQQNQFNQQAGVYAEPLSSESNRQESTHSVANSAANSGGNDKIDDNQASTSSDYRRANKTNSANNSSFDDELRINCGTGQLQKSIGFFSTHKSAGGNNSSTASDNGTKSAKLKRLAHYAGNSVRNVALGSTNSRSNKLNTIRREYKATKTLAIITFVFILMWTPYYLIFLLQTVCADCFIFKNFASHIWHQTLWLGWANSYVNCILYLYFSRKLRNSIINTLLCRRG